MTVVRYDRIELPPKVEFTAEGYLRGDAILTRTGVFEYANADGTIRREYRPPEEVFKPESLASFGLRPLTVNHPPARADGQRLLDAATSARHAVGTTGENVRQDGDFMRAPIAVFDKKAVDAIKAGKRGLSNGYTAELDFTPGVAPDGTHYDAVQRNITGNHVAIVDSPRAGAVATIRLDGNQDIEGDDTMSDRKLSTIKLDGIDYEAAPEVVNALTKATGSLDAQKARADQAEQNLKAKSDEADANKAKLDSALSELETLKKQDRSEEIKSAVKARVALEKVAARVLPSDAKIDEMDDLAIRKAVILAKQPNAKLDEQSDVYVQARFDAIVEALPARDSKIAEQRLAATPRVDGAEAMPKTQDEARRLLMERNRNAWNTKAA